MLTLNEKTLIVDLLSSQIPVLEIARKTGKSVGTIYKYKKIQEQTGNPKGSLGDISPKISAFEDLIKSKVKSGVTNSKKVYEFIKEHGYEGSYPLLNSYIRNIAPKKTTYKRSQHIETGPGEQAQVDWGSFGKIEINGKMERLYAFVYILSYSRAIYVEFVVRQNQQTLQACHIHAFEKLGIPQTIVYDNMKTVVLGRKKLEDGSKKINYNPAFLDFAKYYGFQVTACPPYWPRAKGKVESSVKYLRNNFMAGESFKKTFKSLEELNRKAQKWLEHTAHKRIHRTTGKRPSDKWLYEKKFLSFPGNLPPYNSMPFLVRRSTKDGLVQYKANLYSVPGEFSQKKLYIREIARHGLPLLEVYYKDSIVATHNISTERGKWILDYHHVFEERNKATKKEQHKRKLSKKRRHEFLVVTRSADYYNSIISNKN